jgi:ribose-phosphate pyrophosphokinase
VPRAPIEQRRFPDGETYLRLPPVAGARVLVTADLSDPDAKVLPLLFLASTARELGARDLTLVAPYLPYMRQDARFHPGEAVTCEHFAGLLSRAFDGLVTVDPHLHRRHDLDELFSIPARTVASAPRLAAWVRALPPDVLLVGPDAESHQWVEPVAQATGREHAVMSKVRRGDFDVTTSLPDGLQVEGRPCCLLDDIVSTGHTLADAARRLREAGAASVCALVVHALFSGDALERLRAAGVRRVASTNTLPHETNEVDVVPLLAAALAPAAARASS